MLPEVGETKQGTVARVYKNYAILIFPEGYTGLLHISEASDKYIRNFQRYIKVGSIYSVKIIDVDEKTGNVRVSLKQATRPRLCLQNKLDGIKEEEIDFEALKNRLPLWIQEKEAKHD